MFKIRFVPKIDVSCYASKYGEGDSVPVDQTPVKDFNIDPDTGRAMADITKILKAQTQYEKDKLYKELVSHPSENGIAFDDVKGLQNALKYAVPRFAQLPSELADYTESLYQRHFDEVEKRKQDEREKIDNAMQQDMYENAVDYLEKKRLNKSNPKSS